MSHPDAAPRRRSRQVALQVLYAIDLARTVRPDDPFDPAAAFEAFAENFELPAGAVGFARELVAGVTEARDQLDALLQEHSSHWRLSRMAAVDRNILRLGAYELTRSDTPVQVVLDEAIELARRFGDDPSPAFVNGVLDAVAASVRGGRAAASGTSAEPAR